MRRPESITQYILEQWVDDLGRQLGRPGEQILQDGLSAGDFPSNEELKLTFPDGSTVHFRYAFFVVSKQRRQVAVFTEHCGYHVFPIGETVIERVTRTWLET